LRRLEEYPFNPEDLDIVPPGDLGDDDLGLGIGDQFADDDGVVTAPNEQDNLVFVYVEEKRVRELDLKANGLCGTLPDEIGLLSTIHGRISFSTNLIEGTIPTQIGMLSRLHSFQLDSNEFVSTLPSELKAMRALREFNIANNPGINGTITEGKIGVNWQYAENVQIQGTGLKGRVSYSVCEQVASRDRLQGFDNFVFKASCPSPLDCPCCTECCHIQGNAETCVSNEITVPEADD